MKMLATVGKNLSVKKKNTKKLKSKRKDSVVDRNVGKETSHNTDSAVGAATGCAFTKLELSKPLHHSVISAIAALGFERTTPVQQATIPLLLSNKDVAVQAQTGSGKTAAFLIPAFDLLLRSEEAWRPHDVGCIIIAPTRELSSQIFAVAQSMSPHIPEIIVLSLTGGSDQVEAMREFQERGGNLVIATPGRLEHTMESESRFNVKRLELLVLDEADRLLDMGFQACLNSILARLPKQRRTGLFSATMNTEVTALARAGLRNPRLVKVTVKGANLKQQATPLTLTNDYMICTPDQKLNQLVCFLGEHCEDKCMVYLLTCAHVDYFAALLPLLPNLSGANIMSLHGKMVQKRRSKTYEKFLSCPKGILLCTDVAARGLDIPDVDWIVQYDAPQDPSFFVHRVGRTARFGRAGRSLLFLAPNEDTYINFLTVRNVPLRQVQPGAAADVMPAAKAAVRGDLDLHEKGQRALVSFVRAYKEHQCSFIFQLDKVDLGAAATGMALLRLPRMPELRNVTVKGFKGDSEAVAGLRYKDKVREKARRKREAVRAAEAAERSEEVDRRGEQRVKNLPWSKGKKLAFQPGVGVRKAGGKTEEVGAGAKRGRGADNVDSDSGEEEMMREAALLKKLKQGRITQDQFRSMAGEGWSDDD